MRAPASGAKAKRSVQPDVVAARNGRLFVIEVKTRRRGGAIYIEREKVEKLVEWARRAGPNALPLVGVYVGREYGWRFAPVDRLETTEGGYYKVRREDLSRFLDIRALKAIADASERIDRFL